MKLAFVRAGLAMAAFALFANLPYLYLTTAFGYDDILREPPAQVLAAFTVGGDALIFAWLAFSLCALAFVIVAGFTNDALRAANVAAPSFVLAAGAASALAQAIGLSRWVFVMPVIADLAAQDQTRESALVAYQVVHQFAGVAIGEHIGQTLLAIWTAGLSWVLLRSKLAPAIFGWLGFAIAAAWIVGQSELLATVTATPVIEFTPYAFMGWVLWLLLLGFVWIGRGLREKHTAQ
jgi:hypothetical protein